jgi:putative transposase
MIFVRRARQGGSAAGRKKMIDRTSKLSARRQIIALEIGQGSVYYRVRPVPDADQHLTHRIDKLHTEFPFAGNRIL